MKCPACNTRLHKIVASEWACSNPDCPERKEPAYDVEWYGATQKEINEMYEVTKG